MFGWDDAAMVAAPLIVKALSGGNKNKDSGKWLAYLQNYKPQGWLNPEDFTAAERTTNRMTTTLGTTAAGQRAEAYRRFNARGIAGSPMNEATLGRIGEQEQVGKERARAAGEEQLYGLKLGREKWDASRAMDVARLGIGNANSDKYRSDLRNSTFMNSVLEYTPKLMGYLGGSDSGLPSVGGGTPVEDVGAGG